MTLTAGWQKIFARRSPARLSVPRPGHRRASRRGQPGSRHRGAADLNDRLDAALAGVFMVIVVALVIASVAGMAGRDPGPEAGGGKETPFVESAYAG